MDNNTIIGYNILAKRAIETESGVNIDEALKRITAYRVVRGEGEDNHPASDVTVSTKVIYFTKSDKGYLGWIWVDGEGWVCAGGGSSDSWKVWSEEHGCSASNEDAVYIGFDNTSDADYPSFQIGHDNISTGTVPDYVEPTEQVSFNIGALNSLKGEGVNIGKKNLSNNFGISIGQNNKTNGGGVSIGQVNITGEGAYAIGGFSNVPAGAFSFGNNNNIGNGTIAIGDNIKASSGSIIAHKDSYSLNWIESGGVVFGQGNSGYLSSGIVLIGKSNTVNPGNNNGGYGDTIIGQNNRVGVGSWTYGDVIIGNNNTSADTNNGGNGQVAVGEYCHVKGSGAVAMGTGAVAKYGLALSMKGTPYSSLGTYAESAFAIGQNGIASYYGSFVIGDNMSVGHYGGYVFGWNQVCAQYGAIAIGYNSIYANNSINIGWNNGAALNGSIVIGWNSRLALNKSIAIGYDNCTAEDYSLSFGKNNVFTYSNSIAIGFNQVKGINNSFALGMNSVLAYENSMAIGNGAYASNTALCIFDPSQKPINCFTTQNKQIFSYYDKDNNSGYVEVKFSGVTKQGDVYYSEVTGQTYSSVTSIPWSAYKVKIRGTKDEDGVVHPFYGLDINIDRSEIEDSWVDVEWASSGTNWYGLSSSSIYGPQDLYVNSAAYNGTVIGGAGHARNGSLAICPNMSHYSGSFTISLETDYNSIPTQSYARSNYTSGTYTESYRFHEAIAESDSIAMGVGTWAKSSSTALGTMVKAEYASLALGYGSIGDKYIGTSYGNSLLISGVGYYSDVPSRGFSKDKSIAIGTAPKADDQAVSIGDCTIANRKSIALGAYSRANDESIAIGDDNESKDNAIGIGTMNLSSGWSIALGVNNTSYDGPGGHSTMIGQFNTSTSNQEVIHKEFQGEFIPGVPYEPTEIELSQVSQYRTAVHNALATGLTSSELAIFDSYYSQFEDWGLGRTDNYPSPSQEMNDISSHLTTVPPYNLTTEDKETAVDIFSGTPPFDDWEAMKSLYLSIFEMASKYDSNVTNAFIQELRNTNSEEELTSCLNNHPEMNGPFMKLQQSALYEGEPIQGKLTEEQYNILVSNSDSLSNLLRQIRRKIDTSSEGHYEIIDEDVVCNSFLAGNNNKSNHYNSILIGALNESQTPQVQPDATYHTTDDDGFMIAVGYRNVVGRNYDIAIGHRSKAIGGENVALQHSEAEGYRNFAAFDSKVRGTANVLLGESTLLIPWDGDTTENINELNAATHNLMFNSLSENITQPIGRYMQNVLLDVDLATDAQSVTENFIYGGAGHENNTKVELTAGTAVTGNVILGSQHGSNPLQITCTNAIIDNIISHPSSIVANASYAFHRNILIGQKYVRGRDPAPIMNITGAETIIKNIVIHSSIIGKARTFINNIILNDSQIESTYDQGDGGCVINNILLNNATLVNTDVETWWYGSYRQPCTDNIVVGANVSDSINSVIISDSNAGAQISDALRIFNFGDNSAMHVAEGRVFGGYNTIQCAKKFFISGDQNTVTSNAEAIGTVNGANSFTTIFGSANSVTSIPDADYSLENARNTIFGCQNAIRGSGVADNSIFGSCNQIGSFDTDYNITECFVSGSDNLISSRVNSFTILGKSNSVHCDGGPSGNKLWAIGNGFVQGNDNRVYFGSNTIAMGNGNIVEGHNAVAIGCQLKSRQWQTVIGKYNQPVDGPDRLTSADDPSQSNKALFIVGNGYSTKDDRDWKDEQFITRSNAMVVYANGDTVFSGNVNATNLPPAPSNDGRYALNCIVTNGVPSYSWVPVGTVTV